MKPVLQISFASLIGAGAIVVTSAAADAHAFLIDSFPTHKQRLAAPLNTVKLRFAGKADALYSTVSLERADGAVLATRVQPEASRDFHLPAPPLQPGRYLVRYRVLSTDGDVIEGKLDFVVDEANGSRL